MAEHIEYQGNFSGSQIDTLLAKIQSSQVFSTEEKTKLASLVNYDDTEVKEDISDIETSLNNKVEKVNGKGLSTNDFTNNYKTQITTNKNGIAALANSGSKNRLNTYLAAVKPFNTAGTWSDNVYTHNGVTFTVNDDGSLTLNGTSTGNGSDFFLIRDAGTSFGGLVLTGSLPSNSGDAGMSIIVGGPSGTAEIGRSRNGNPYTIPVNTNVVRIFLHLIAGEKETNRTMYPMIQDASIEDSTYTPYAPTNRELYEMILSLQSGT